MDVHSVDRIADWLVRLGLDGTPEPDLLRAFCEQCRIAGLQINHGLMFIDTLHPVHEGTIFHWRDDGSPMVAASEYGRSDEDEAASAWQRSPFFHVLQRGQEEPRRRIGFGEEPEFAIIRDMRQHGPTTR